MKQFILSRRALDDYTGLAKELQKRVDKQLSLLVRNFLHPSLRAKKYDESRGIWQARVTDSVRFYFLIERDCFIILDIDKHRD